MESKNWSGWKSERRAVLDAQSEWRHWGAMDETYFAGACSRHELITAFKSSPNLVAGRICQMLGRWAAHLLLISRWRKVKSLGDPFGAWSVLFIMDLFWIAFPMIGLRV